MFEMNERDLRSLLYYEFKCGRKAAQTCRNVNEVYGDGTVDIRFVQHWFRKFRNGDQETEDKEPSAGLAADYERSKTIAEAEHETMVKRFAKEPKIKFTAVDSRLHHTRLSAVIDKWTPKVADEKQKLNRYKVCSALLLRNSKEQFLSRILTYGAKWILYGNRKRSFQMMEQNEAAGRFPEMDLDQKMVMINVWWCKGGVVHCSFINSKDMITEEKFIEEIRVMHEKLQHLYPKFAKRRGRILLYDDNQAFISHTTVDVWNDMKYETLTPPECSPDLLPSEYYLFSHFDSILKTQELNNQAAVEEAFVKFINSKGKKYYAAGINSLVARWQKCLDCKGSFIN
uniref:HTH_48 domain-containing protein n=1 Tax=Trichuris muris TaxID=70415 RepID=A0A5S6Q7V1_TRIMR